ncbi:hypothetical protein GEU84_007045 [Fertoebacter nigrum]|uniref:Uncharacterized protein n=1 Tax=Fertoeibacter niger TaxID=2656921 RepID=A0A8X8H0Z0_9RHOB|nr:hypothetical protein [Fertoeibacter niger]NUB44132.1 hypothetical protein [Fertoeibacter niger]
MQLRLTLLALLLATPVTASPIAEIICAPRQQMEQRLTGQYQAGLQGSGLRDRDSVMEVWAAANGRWTLVLRYTSGQSCIVAMGEAWDAPLPNPA